MKARVQEREQAIQLRREGFSYNDILREIPVAKSTLSNWLKDLPLTNEEKQTLKNAKVAILVTVGSGPPPRIAVIV